MGQLAAGNLTEKLYLREQAATKDGQGGRLPGVTTPEILCYASVKVISGTEVLRLGQALGSSVVVFTIRYRPSVTTATLARWNGKSVSVKSVVHDHAKREFTVLTCVDNGRA